MIKIWSMEFLFQNKVSLIKNIPTVGNQQQQQIYKVWYADERRSGHKVAPLSNYAEIFRNPDFICPSSERIENFRLKSGSQ